MYSETFLLIALICGVRSSLLDVFGLTNGHEPRVALRCGKVPFYVDMETGRWVADSEGKQACDGDKEEVKSLCQKMYPKLNITNIVEANDPVEFKNWCAPGSSQCDEVRKVVPYRCLVNEYEADALMVPDSCKFDHVHDKELCMTHDQWRERAEETCTSKYGMKVKDYGILLSCKTDLFTGVEFVCCPERVIIETREALEKAKQVEAKKEEEHKQEEVKKEEEHEKHVDILIPSKIEIDHELFATAIRNFQTYLPMETKGCDRSNYLTKQTEMEERHRNQIAAVVDEWDEAERRYNELKVKDPNAAEEKMKRTLEVFRQTLAALEEESKEEKNRLRAEHADCINTQINKDKRDAMINYLQAIEEQPVSAEKILEAVRNFIQVCEHDRVHSLRHFEHVRNRDPEKADSMRGELLQHLKDLNIVVNESMALLNYLPEIAEQFGLGSMGGAVLKPRLEMPEEETHSHDRVEEILKQGAKKYGSIEVGSEKVGSTTEKVINPTDDLPVEPKPNSDVITPNFNLEEKRGKEEENEAEEIYEREKELIAEALERESKRMQQDDDVDDDDDEEDEEERYVRLHPKHPAEQHEHADKKTPTAIAAILGLSFGILVIMLFIVIAMVVRRRRMNYTRVVLSENGDDREHLVQMQKSGFENPTYKFFYY